MLRTIAVRFGRRFQGPKSVSLLQPPFRRWFATGEGQVSIHLLAVYIHDQINGTFPDIFQKLDDLVNVLEYPNSGAATLVDFKDARLMVEDIGAHADDLEDFLADYESRDKDVGFHKMPEEDLHTARPRHPRHAAHGLKGTAMPSIHDTWEDDLPTEDLLVKSRSDADGIWFQPNHTMGWIVHSRTSTYKLKRKYMDKLPIDTTFNVWYKSHMSPGWRPCAGGGCSGRHPPRWWKVDDHPPPFTDNREVQRQNCIGFCPMARRKEIKGWKPNRTWHSMMASLVVSQKL